MDVEKYLYDRVVGALRGVPLDRDKLHAGIGAFARDNGFAQLAGRFGDDVIRQVLDGSADAVLEEFGPGTGLYFTHYQLIEDVRLLNNRTLELADDRRRTGSVEPGLIEQAEREFNEKMAEISRAAGLFPMLTVQISEIVSNIDYARGTTDLMGQRLSDLAGGKR